MIRSLFFITLFGLLTTFTTGCGGGLTKIAENVLYPFDQVDKKYPVPENPPEGLQQVYFEVPSTEEGETLKVHAWYHYKGTKARTLVHFHGNGENVQVLHLSKFQEVLGKLGFNYIIIDYPGLGRSEGTPNQQNLANAGLAALKFAKSKLRGSKTIVWGRSLGAAVAAQVASQGRTMIDGLILTSPWNNFIDVAIAKTSLAKNLPEEWIAKHKYDSAEALKDFRLPTMIHHGLIDDLIPIKFGRLLFQSFPAGAPVQMFEIPAIGHNDMYQLSDFWHAIKDFNP